MMEENWQLWRGKEKKKRYFMFWNESIYGTEHIHVYVIEGFKILILKKEEKKKLK
jgi:hypothetical protein